jgi:hypothetical protein
MASLMSLAGCSNSNNVQGNVNYDTELNCPHYNYRVALLEVAPGEVRRAIDKALEVRMQDKTTENYTVLKLSNKKTFFVPGITPENMQYCYLIAIPVGNPQ